MIFPRGTHVSNDSGSGSDARMQLSPEAPFLMDLFKAFNESNIQYCVLRNYEALPYCLCGSDVDILTSSRNLMEALESIRAVASKHRAWTHQLRKIDSLFAIRCFGIGDGGVQWGVHIDLHTTVRWKGLTFYDVEQVLSNAVWSNGIRVAGFCDAHLVAFLKEVLYLGRVRKDYAIAAVRVYGLRPEMVEEQMMATFGKRGELVLGLLRGEDFRSLKRVARKLRRVLLMRQILKWPLSVFWNKLTNLLVHCRQLCNRPGIFVAVLGVDGAGKSTLIRLVQSDIERLVHMATEHRHLRPGLLLSLAVLVGRGAPRVGPLSNPHSQPASGTICSVLRLAYYTLDYLLGYWIYVYPMLAKKPTVLFFDRYFYDYFIDPARFRVNAPRWVVQIFAWFVPRPDIIILLTGDPELVQRRKRELPFGELQSQTQRMQRFAERFKGSVWIDTSDKVEDSKREMVEIIFKKPWKR